MIIQCVQNGLVVCDVEFGGLQQIDGLCGVCVGCCWIEYDEWLVGLYVLFVMYQDCVYYVWFGGLDQFDVVGGYQLFWCIGDDVDLFNYQL